MDSAAWFAPKVTLAVVSGLLVAWVVWMISSLNLTGSRCNSRESCSAAIESLRKLALRRVSWTTRFQMERQLMHAGLFHWQVADLVLLYAVAMLVGGITVGLGGHSLGGALAGAMGVFLAVRVWMKQRTQRYSSRIGQQLPAFLDLLCLCLGAGMSLNAGLLVVLRYSQDGPLRVLWQDWLFDVRAGSTRIEAFSRLRLKSTQPSLQRLCVAMIQAERSGAALAGSLKLQSKQIRQDQMVAAEKRAAQAPMRMLLPLIVCFFPSTFLVLAFSIWVGVSDSL